MRSDLEKRAHGSRRPQARRCAGSVAMAIGAAIMVGLGSTRVGATHPSSTAADPLGCAQQVFDPFGIAGAALDSAASDLAESLGADLHVRIEGSLDGNIDGREQRLEAGCAGWLASDGRRAPDLLVVMVSPTERSTSLYFGSTFEAALTPAGREIQEFVMNPQFKLGNVEQGLVDGLDAIRVAQGGGDVPGARAPTYDGPSFSIPTEQFAGTSSSSPGDVPVGGIVMMIVLLVIVAIIAQTAKINGWSSSSSTSGYRRSRGSSSRRSFSSSSRSSSSRRSSSSSSSRRSGGGGSSSKW